MNNKFDNCIIRCREKGRSNIYNCVNVSNKTQW